MGEPRHRNGLSTCTRTGQQCISATPTILYSILRVYSYFTPIYTFVFLRLRYTYMYSLNSFSLCTSFFLRAFYYLLFTLSFYCTFDSLCIHTFYSLFSCLFLLACALNVYMFCIIAYPEITIRHVILCIQLRICSLALAQSVI